MDDSSVKRIVDKENPASAHGFLQGEAARAVFWVGVAFSAFQIWTATFTPLPTQAVRSIHVGFLLLVTFLLFNAREADSRSRIPWYDWLLGAGGFALGFYHWVFEAELIQRAGDPNQTDLLVGTIVIALVFEGSRRIMGWSLPIMCGVFIPYALLGPWLPGPLAHRGFGFDQLIDQLFLGTEGIYGTPTFVSATYIFLFILFGSFLEHAGMIRLFNDVSIGLVGWAKGGPAKVAVISSGLMGTINGSGVANVLTVGQFTIPLMVRFGYRPAFAGAVEATASMGGQIMPPVMGAVAFIMAETLGIPYSEVAIAAIIPAVLYYGSAFWMVHLEAGRHKLVGIPRSECPDAFKAIREGWYLLLPVAALVVLLFSGYTPLFAGVIGLACTLVLILGNGLTVAMKTNLLRIVFWLAVAGGAVALSRAKLPHETVAASVVGVLVIASGLLARGRSIVQTMVGALADGAKNAVGVGMACALVGVLIGVTTLTGIASSFATAIVEWSGGNLFFALVLTMIACIILGTGLPTIPNYIITASIAAPALLKLGVPLIVSHMFCFYFGIMADLTPPVALAALAASSIARAGHMEIGWLASRIALAGYVVPFMTVYDPALMLQGDPTVWQVAYVLSKACLAIALWGGAAIGYFMTELNWPERIWATVGAFLLVLAVPLTDELGFAASAAFVGWQWWRSKKP
ncbi:MAG: TRAP transporter permease [Alphaproteobacteria bacterium]|nr:TRAP transporter permease [Alphaproteobacteria bacterium]